MNKTVTSIEYLEYFEDSEYLEYFEDSEYIEDLTYSVQHTMNKPMDGCISQHGVSA